ncbi:MAG TPA: hypothetical protein VFN61_03065 [Acidimicrobiales bacterium]|nr:hypothetical protein [Acidimicrobiales bacterium]
MAQVEHPTKPAASAQAESRRVMSGPETALAVAAPATAGALSARLSAARPLLARELQRAIGNRAFVAELNRSSPLGGSPVLVQRVQIDGQEIEEMDDDTFVAALAKMDNVAIKRLCGGQGGKKANADEVKSLVKRIKRIVSASQYNSIPGQINFVQGLVESTRADCELPASRPVGDVTADIAEANPGTKETEAAASSSKERRQQDEREEKPDRGKPDRGKPDKSKPDKSKPEGRPAQLGPSSSVAPRRLPQLEPTSEGRLDDALTQLRLAGQQRSGGAVSTFAAGEYTVAATHALGDVYHIAAASLAFLLQVNIEQRPEDGHRFICSFFADLDRARAGTKKRDASKRVEGDAKGADELPYPPPSRVVAAVARPVLASSSKPPEAKVVAEPQMEPAAMEGTGEVVVDTGAESLGAGRATRLIGRLFKHFGSRRATELIRHAFLGALLPDAPALLGPTATAEAEGRSQPPQAALSSGDAGPARPTTGDVTVVRENTEPRLQALARDGRPKVLVWIRAIEHDETRNTDLALLQIMLGAAEDVGCQAVLIGDMPSLDLLLPAGPEEEILKQSVEKLPEPKDEREKKAHEKQIAQRSREVVKAKEVMEARRAQAAKLWKKMSDRHVNFTQFWKWQATAGEEKGGEFLKGERRVQRQLLFIDMLRNAGVCAQMGVKSGAMDGPALMGLPTLILDKEVDPSLRLRMERLAMQSHHIDIVATGPGRGTGGAAGKAAKGDSEVIDGRLLGKPNEAAAGGEPSDAPDDEKVVYGDLKSAAGLTTAWLAQHMPK